MHYQHLILFCIIAATLAANEKPRFKFSETNKIMLSWEETWEVGSSNMLAFLNTDKRLIIKIVVVGNVGTGLRRILQFKCRRDYVESMMDMESLKSSSNEVQCKDTIPFSVRLKNERENEFDFTLLSSKLPYSHAFSDKIELRVRIEHSSGVLESNSLFVWNLDAIGKLNPDGRRFLSAGAEQFLKRMSENMPDTEFDSTQFLDPAMSQIIKEAPEFLKPKINIGAILNFDAGTCESYQISRASLFVNYHSKLDERNQNLLKHIYLDTETGLLHYSRYGLSSIISDFFSSKSPVQIGICATLSFAGQGQPYDKTFSIAQKIPKTELSYKTLGDRNSNCKIIGSTNQKAVTIFSGMDYTPLVCPIICNSPNQVYRFFHGDKGLVPDTRRDWTEVNGIRISKTGNIIEFPPIIYNKHSGAYTCVAGGTRFTFNTQVISMPQFTSKSYGSSSSSEISGNLPPTVYAMEGEGLSYNCTAYFTNVATTNVLPVFYSAALGENNWKKYDLDSFNRLMATPVSNVITVPKVSQLESMTLTFNIGKVPPANPSTGLNFTHRCVCDVTVGTADTQKIGMPSYSVQSGSSVFFLSRPLLNSFDISMAKNCSLQSCTASDGAYFQFSLKPQLAAYLKAIGVSVTGYFKIDDDYLDFVKVLNQPDVAKVSYDPDTTKLSFKVNRITKPEVLTELQSRKTLTPIFNFRYEEGTKSPNLVFDKKRYGPRQLVAGKRDCRSDDLCFYSTDFDADTTLQGLMLGLDFKGQPVVGENAATASTSIIVGIILAIVLLLIIAVLIVFLLRRDTGQTYLLDEKERQQGNHPEQEAKEEQFKEYQRPEEGPLKARQMSVGSSISAGSKDDQELEEYGNDDIDCTKFVEDGSFIGDYSTDARRRDAFNAHQV